MTDSKLYKGLLIAGVAAAGAALVTGCNSSSSSSNGGSGGGAEFSDLTQEQQEASVAGMAMEIDEIVLGMGEMGNMATGMAGVESNFEHPGASDGGMAGVAGVHDDGDQASLAGWGDLCDTGGSYTIHADKTDHFHVKFDSCSSEQEFDGATMSHFINGELETRAQDSDTHEHRVTSRADDYEVEVHMSGDGGSLDMAFKMNGESVHHYSAWNNYILAANQSMEMSMSCDGSETFGGTFSFDDLDVSIEPSTQNADDAEMRASGSYSFEGGAMGGTWEMNTRQPVHFPQYGNPYAGEMEITVDGQSFVVKYTDSGVYVNDEYYSWDRLETIEEDIDDDFDDFDMGASCEWR